MASEAQQQSAVIRSVNTPPDALTTCCGAVLYPINIGAGLECSVIDDLLARAFFYICECGG